MIIDKKLELCDAVVIDGGAGKVDVGEVLDLDDLTRIGSVNPMSLFIGIVKAPTGGTSVQFSLRTGSAIANDNDLGGIPLDITISPVFTRANLTANSYIILPLTAGSLINYQRYLQLAVTRVGNISGNMSINAHLVCEPWDWVAQKVAGSFSLNQ